VLLYLSAGRARHRADQQAARLHLQDGGLDTVDANRALGWGRMSAISMVAAAMLSKTLGMTRIRLLTNNPDKSRRAGGLRD
jgi:GTP cyclohydrolase II